MNSGSKRNKEITAMIHNSRYVLFGIMVVVLTHIIISLIYGAGLFGDKIYVGGDNQMFFGALAEMKRKILEGDSVLYSWHALGGYNFYFSFVTCLFNGSLLLLSLVPIAFFNDACDILFLVNSVLMFLTMEFYLANRESGKRFEKNSWESLLFAIPYALAPQFYNMSLNINYATSYIIMPLVILGLEKFVVNKGWKLYFVSLVFLMISNTYMGFIGCIFIILYYFTLEFNSFKDFWAKSIRIFGISIIAVLVSAFYFVPMVLSSSEGGYGFSEFQGAGFYVDWLKIFDKALWGTPFFLSGNATEDYWLCNLYVGILTIALVLFYFVNGKLTLKTKFRRLIVLLVLCLAINGKTCNYVMHLFHYTHGIHNRHVMFLIFYLLTIAGDSFVILSRTGKKRRRMKFMLITIILMGIIVVDAIVNFSRLRIASFAVSFLLLGVYGYLFLMNKRINYNRWGLVLISVLTLEMFANYALFFNYPLDRLDKDVYSEEQFNSLPTQEISVKGIEKCGYNYISAVYNLGLIYGFNTYEGCTNNASAGFNKDLSKLGIDSSEMMVDSKGYNSFLNSILSRKYIVESNKNKESEYSDYDGYKLRRLRDVELFENDKCLSPLMLCNDYNSFKNFSMYNEVSSKGVNGYNNALCYSLSGVKGLISNENVNVEIDDVSKCEAELNGQKLTIRRKYNGLSMNDYAESAEVSISFVIPEDGEYMVYGFENQNVGFHKKGERIKTSVFIEGRSFVWGETISCDIVVNRLDLDKFAKAYSIIEKNQMNIESFESGYIKGDVNAAKDTYMFTTIPYDSSWKIMVDNQSVEAECLGDGLLTFPVSEGNHVIEMKYTPLGVKEGIIVSVVALIISLGMLLFYKPFKQK